MTAGVRKPEAQWINNKRKAANLDERLKSLIMSVLPDDQINPVINCKIAKSTWEDLIVYHEGPFDVKENRVMDLRLCYNTFKFKKGENLAQTFTIYKALVNELVKNQCLIAEAYEWDEEEMSSDDNEMLEVKGLMTHADDESGDVGTKSARNGEWVKISMRKANDLVFVKSLADDTNVSIPNVERPWLSETEGFNFPNHDTDRILPSKSQVKINDSSVNVTYSLVTGYDSAKESSSICSTPLPILEKLAGVEPISGPKTTKSILKSCSTVKTYTLKGVIINEPTHSSAPAKGNKNVLVSKKGSTSACKLKNVKTKDDIPLSVVMKELNDLKLQIRKNQSAYSRNNKPQQVPQTPSKQNTKHNSKRGVNFVE
nr:retrovirus-related Pol polyprotein from transposon TNT 1-94 [Tanacetum cinerariifolium]